MLNSINKMLEQCIQSLIDERKSVAQQIGSLKSYEETLINDARHFKRLLKRRVDEEAHKNAVDNLAIRIIISTRNQRRAELWNKI